MGGVADVTVPPGDEACNTTNNPQIDGAYYLLPELYPMILVKLPIKSLIQCTSVCKQWRSIITSPAFSSAHLSLSRQNPLLLTAASPKPHNPSTFALNFDTDPPLRLSQAFHCPFPTGEGSPYRVVGSVDGIIFLVGNSWNPYTMILWNPSIRKFFTLPMPRINDHEIGPYNSVLGFGFDSASNDYKVVRLVSPLGHGDNDTTPLLVEVFSLRERSWRTISTNVDYRVLQRQCFMCGAVHWIGRNHLGIGILLFDVGKEEFNRMALPQDENANCALSFSISVIGGMLSVFVMDSPDVFMNIWVKRDYFADSWTKMLSLDFKELHLGGILYLRRVWGGGYIHVPATIGYDQLYESFVISYTESLLLLGEEDTPFQEVVKVLEKTHLGTNTD